eukprot:6492792-Alexandrium_andersonii.AAC.1
MPMQTIGNALKLDTVPGLPRQMPVRTAWSGGAQTKRVLTWFCELLSTCRMIAKKGRSSTTTKRWLTSVGS